MIKQLSGVCLLAALLIGCGSDNSRTSYQPPSYDESDPAPTEPSDPMTPPGSSEPPPTTEPTEPTSPPSEGAVVDGTAVLQWTRPEQRENGEYLEADDIGGYELRYRKVTESEFEAVVIDDGWAERYEIASLVGTYRFQVATFDREGLYSEFVDIAPY